MDASDISIVLLTRNGGSLFSEALAALMRCDGISEAEVLIIDSGSTDGTVAAARRYEQIRIHRIPPGEFGHGRTRNLGVRMTSRPIVVFLVQDATPVGPRFLKELTAPLADSSVAATFGRQIAYDWTNRIEKLFITARYPPKRVVRQRNGDGPMGIEDIFFSNVCSAIRRSVLEHIPFDEGLIMSEDQLWAKSALKAGWRVVYQPSAVVRHSHNYGFRALFRRNFDSGASLVGVVENSVVSMVKHEMSYLSFGLDALMRTGDARFIPYFLAYEAVRVTAFAIGQRAHRLPPSVATLLSLHGSHWGERAR